MTCEECGEDLRPWWRHCPMCATASDSVTGAFKESTRRAAEAAWKDDIPVPSIVDGVLVENQEAAYEQRLIDEATASERERWLPLLVAAKEVLTMHLEEVFYDPRFADLRKAVEQLDK